MKRSLKFFIATLLAIAVLLAAIAPIGAARPGSQFVSDLHLAEAKDEETAKKILTDNGYTVLDKNLNPNADTAVYLGYQTTSNAELAITDISVMNMLGDFNITDYDTALEKSLYNHTKMISDLRIAANEFSENYTAGTTEAQLAYRLLNRYYLDEDMEKLKMGDYVLRFPADDAVFTDVLMKSNSALLGNLRSILALGVGDGNSTLTERIAATSEDESVYQKSEYNEDAKTLYHTLVQVKSDMDALAEAIAEVEADVSLTDKERSALTEMMTLSFSKLITFRSIIESFPLKDSTYGEYLKQQDYLVFDYSVFYPIIEAMTAGQRAMIPAGQLISVVIYDAIRADLDKLETTFDELEQEFPRLNLLLGADLDLYEGSLAVTSGAIRNESKTGIKWATALGGADENASFLSASLVGLGGLGLLNSSCFYVAEVLYGGADAPAEHQSILNRAKDLKPSMATLDSSIEICESLAEKFDGKYAGFHTVKDVILGLSVEYSRVPTILRYASSYATPSALLSGSTSGFALGTVIMNLNLYSTNEILNRYNAQYTDIPSNIVDCVETESGSSYVRYGVVNTFYYDGDTLKVRPGDTNAYGGDQWNAIYFTKDPAAGKCLLDAIDLPANADGADLNKYNPVHSFDQRNTCYDLNKYASEDEDENESVFLAFKTSNDQKDGETFASLFIGSKGALAAVVISGICGIPIGILIMNFIHKKKEKEEEIIS